MANIGQLSRRNNNLTENINIIIIEHFLFQYVENFLFNFGLDGKGCLLRAICETHETPLLGHGMVGEILELFLTWVARLQPRNANLAPFLMTLNDQ